MPDKNFNVLLKTSLTLSTQSRLLTIIRQKTFKTIIGKGENADNQHFLLVPQCFLPFEIDTSCFEQQLISHILMLSIVTWL